jgi:hypothetical protein
VPLADALRCRRHATDVDSRLSTVRLFLVVACLLLSGCDAIIHQALGPKRVQVDPVSVEPMFVFMHNLGVQSYGTFHFCDYVIDQRGTFVSDLKAGGCDGFAADGQVAQVLDTHANRERAALHADQQSLGIPTMHDIDIVYDDHHLLAQAGFEVDSCVIYTFEPAAPMDLDQSSPPGRGSSPWTTEDVCPASP